MEVNEGSSLGGRNSQRGAPFFRGQQRAFVGMRYFTQRLRHIL